jgi:hypothetical protein
MQSPQPPTTPHSQSCFQSDQIIVPEGDLPRVEQNDVFDVRILFSPAKSNYDLPLIFNRTVLILLHTIFM